MSAFFVSRIKVKDTAKMQEYAANAGPTIKANNGAMVLRGAAAETLIGDDAGDHVTSIVQFPDIETLNTWFNSPAYQRLSSLRDEAGDMQFVAYQVPNV